LGRFDRPFDHRVEVGGIGNGHATAFFLGDKFVHPARFQGFL
jgi:hypothetical protein